MPRRTMRPDGDIVAYSATSCKPHAHPSRELQLRRALRHLAKAQDELASAVHELTHLARDARASSDTDGGEEDYQRVATRYALAAKTTTEHLVEYSKALSFWIWYARLRREQRRAAETTVEESEAAA